MKGKKEGERETRDVLVFLKIQDNEEVLGSYGLHGMTPWRGGGIL